MFAGQTYSERTFFENGMRMAFPSKIANLRLTIGMGCLLVAGCTSQKVLQATGGSRADGTVNLSFETGMFEKPVIDWDQAGKVARKRCEAWGYTDAEAFGGTTTQCQAYNGYGGCVQAFVTVPFQCINNGAAPPAASANTAPVYPAPAAAPPAVSTYVPPAGTAPTAALPSNPPTVLAPLNAPPASTMNFDPQQQPGSVEQPVSSTPVPQPAQSGSPAKPPPIIVFEHASDATSPNQSGDFDDLINSVANGAKPPAKAN